MSSADNPASASELVTAARTKPADPDSASLTVTDAFTETSRWLGGQSRFGVTAHDVEGGVLSILIVTDFVGVPPALGAWQVSVEPAVSALRVVVSQPVVETMDESGSLTLQE